MRRRPITAFHPELERIEAKQLLSAGAWAAQVAHLKDGSRALAGHPAETSVAHSRPTHSGAGYLMFRVTNTPYQLQYKLVPPFQQVLVQRIQPVPGQVYNVLYVAVKNGTAQTFNASSGFTVRLPGFTGTHRVTGHAFPILTGNEQWAPGQVIVFYALSKKYYPLSPQVAAGYQFDLGGRSSTAVPGPSGIFLRLTYDPAKFARTLDWIVAYGQGAQLGQGPKYGLPDTAINEFVSAKTQRIDFAGHF
jgi:hypothetical protein